MNGWRAEDGHCVACCNHFMFLERETTAGSAGPGNKPRVSFWAKHLGFSNNFLMIVLYVQLCVVGFLAFLILRLIPHVSMLTPFVSKNKKWSELEIIFYYFFPLSKIFSCFLLKSAEMRWRPSIADCLFNTLGGLPSTQLRLYLTVERFIGLPAETHIIILFITSELQLNRKANQSSVSVFKLSVLSSCCVDEMSCLLLKLPFTRAAIDNC